MSNNFRVGQRLVCIHRSPCVNGMVENPLEVDQVYTLLLWDGPLIQLTEIPPYMGLSFMAMTFDPQDFRPAVERSTDTGMSILRKILTDNRVDA